jgi:hypothetical protein
VSFYRGAVRRDLRALGRARGAKRGINKLEQAYAEHLETRRHAGQIQWFAFEAIKLRLADATFFQPDFFVQRMDGALECHEVKGFWEEDARIKIKVAAALYPFQFLGVTRAPGPGGVKVWQLEEF